MEGVVADRYAQALLAAATEQNRAEAVLKQVEWYQTVAAHAISPLLENPKIPNKAKEGLVAKLFQLAEGEEGEAGEGGSGGLKFIISLVRLLLRKGRIRSLRDIFQLYKKRYTQQMGIVAAKLYTAYPMEQETLDRLRLKVSERLGKTVAFEVIPDPEILGGFIVVTHTHRLDASLARALVDLGERLKAVPVS